MGRENLPRGPTREYLFVCFLNTGERYCPVLTRTNVFVQVKSHKTQPILYGTVIQFLLYGEYKGDVFATGGQVEIALVSMELMINCGDSMTSPHPHYSPSISLCYVSLSVHAFNMTLFPRNPEGFTTRPRPFPFPRLTRSQLMKPSKNTSTTTLPSE